MELSIRLRSSSHWSGADQLHSSTDPAMSASAAWNSQPSATAPQTGPQTTNFGLMSIPSAVVQGSYDQATNYGGDAKYYMNTDTSATGSAGRRVGKTGCAGAIIGSVVGVVVLAMI